MLSNEDIQTPQEALRWAKFLAGGSGSLARKIGITAQAISQWEVVPANRVLAVERAIEGKVPRHRLRPDIYPPEEESAAS